MSKEYKYKFSVVIPVFNVENYLAETVESVMAQTMDFQRNCEIIFVNDGSTDGSEVVCQRYQEKFPANIIYIKQSNAGPGAARNNGVARAKGKYISLLDSDDKLSANTFAEVYRFIEAHYDEIDLVGIKWEFFEARHGGHPLNDKFTADRVIDLRTEFTSIQGSAAPAFFKESVLRQHTFDPAVGRYSEDARFMGEVLLDRQKFGVVTKPTYFYRKRHSQTSSQDKNMTDKFWYLETPKRAWYELFEYARQRQGGVIPKFIQFMAMYDLQWRFKQQVQTVLTDAEQAEYKALLYGLLPEIADDVIVAQRQIGMQHKIFILSKKNGENVMHKIRKQDSKYYYRDIEVYDLAVARPLVHIEMLEADGDMLRIEGFYSGLLAAGATLKFRIGDDILDSETVDRPLRRVQFLGEFVASQNGFKIKATIHPPTPIEAFVSDDAAKLPFAMHRFAYLSDTAQTAYRVCGSWLIRKKPNQLHVQRYTRGRRAVAELRYLGSIAKRLKISVFLKQFAMWRQTSANGQKVDLGGLKWTLVPAKSAIWNLYTILIRATYFIIKPFYRRPIWLVSDRIMAADDSGEIFFRYLQENQDVKANVYFSLSKKSDEFAKLKQHGHVLNHGSLRHRLLFLMSSKVISSEATDSVINLFGARVHDFVDLYTFDFVFLQHGIIRDDISGWLNRYNKNIKLFVTSARPEYESIVHGDYDYDESVVKLTGLPRYDKLRNQPKGKLLIMPTWRENLAGKVEFKSGQRLYNPAFKASEYFAFYQNLINDDQLQAAIQKHGLQGEFYIHPSFQQQIKDFSGNDSFKIMQMPFDYPNAKCEGNLLVTDYSSVAFDFAYLKKPILYAHFDEDTFYKNHTSNEGYFFYENDGFGPVTYDYESTVKQIIISIESGCTMHDKYQNRVKKFFAYNDRNNSQRIYQAILATNSDK